jgi:hypothetical protein
MTQLPRTRSRSTATSGCRKLREKLNRLTNPPRDAGLEWLDHQIEEIAKLNEACSHGIRLVTRSSHATSGLNCYICALNLDPDAIEDRRTVGIQPDKPFVRWLLKTTRLIKRTDDPRQARNGDIVLYSAGPGKLRHARTWNGEKVISKWGDGRTHVWEHGLWEVPRAYGRVFSFTITGSSSEDVPTMGRGSMVTADGDM